MKMGGQTPSRMMETKIQNNRAELVEDEYVAFFHFVYALYRKASRKVGVVEHRCMREAYKEATEILNGLGHDLLPWQVQAIAWCGIRGSAE